MLDSTYKAELLASGPDFRTVAISGPAEAQIEYRFVAPGHGREEIFVDGRSVAWRVNGLLPILSPDFDFTLPSGDGEVAARVWSRVQRRRGGSGWVIRDFALSVGGTPVYVEGNTAARKEASNGDVLKHVLGGGLFGAWAVSFFIHLCNAFSQPAMLRDGQYMFVFLGTVPAGWLLGALGALAWFGRQQPYREWGLLVAVGFIIAGVILSPIAVGVGMPLIVFTIGYPVGFIVRLIAPST